MSMIGTGAGNCRTKNKREKCCLSLGVLAIRVYAPDAFSGLANVDISTEADNGRSHIRNFGMTYCLPKSLAIQPELHHQLFEFTRH